MAAARRSRSPLLGDAATEEHAPLLERLPSVTEPEHDSKKSTVKHNLRYLFLNEVTRILILGGLCLGCNNATQGYQVLTDRSYICALYYAIHPDDPAKNTEHPCRQPQIERTLATFTGVVESASGVISAISLLLFCKWARRIGVKNLLLISMVADLVFTKLPYYLVPLGPPLGSSSPWLNPVAAQVVISAAIFFRSVCGGQVLTSFAVKSMLIDSTIARPSELGKVLSRYLIISFVSVAIAPMLVVGFTRWADHYWGRTSRPSLPPPSHELQPGAAPSPIPAPTLPENGGGHHPHAYFAGILMDLVTITWCVFLTRNTDPCDTVIKAVVDAPSEAGDDVQLSRPTSSSAAILKRFTRPLLQVFKPLAILSPTYSDVHGDSVVKRPDWTLTRIAICSSSAMFFAVMGQVIFEYLTYSFGYTGEDMSVLLSVLCAVTSVVILLGFPIIYAILEERMERPLELRNMTRKELNALGNDIDALEHTSTTSEPSPGRDAHLGEAEAHGISTGSHSIVDSTPAALIPEDDRRIFHRNFALWRVRIELGCSQITILTGTLPWLLMGATLVFFGSSNAVAGTILVGLTMLTGVSMNAEGPLTAGALVFLKARGLGTVQRDEFVTALNFVHHIVLFTAPLVGSFIYAVTLTSFPGLVYFVAAAGLTTSAALIPRRIRSQ
ncbi:hypothetical protein A4X06_0g582 [Tilletia controversa]|uniref:Uncharacterized protein n=1 Tax=Tilletia controversa TaxID=13291 RepID=A0A8X7T008_9BASI|nr:hypothetical protein CF328_g799 [Tilletia controversa]KAE8255115.1 hypothetical protein A4X06_0g582 [Tilletia controversa]CAD6977813.1 unnamed protein product [Tilletia controversa]